MKEMMHIRYDTGAAPEIELMRKGRKLLHQAKVKKTDFSVIMIDIDYFKKVNDQFGHSVGDLVLKKVVELGDEFMRKTDVFGRFGGFVICLYRDDSCFWTGAY